MKDCSVDASYIPGYDVHQVCFILCIVLSTLSHLRTYGPLGLIRNEFSTHKCVNVFENADLHFERFSIECLDFQFSLEA